MPTYSEFSRVRLILLLREWDPIGIASFEDYNEATDDEYDSYARHIAGLIAKRSTVQELVAFLRWATTDNMGLSEFDDSKNLRVAQLLLSAH